MSEVELEEVRNKVDELLELWLIKPSSRPWGAPLFAAYKDGDLRFCIDTLALNRLT